ncbi:MAG: hypothetical protein JXR51_11565 [Bacteroidales bacterium]|nr:hypothetical protein [Bacteroidales bacterium]MBN2757808.1 hypothetical protein [Bacteroidales bacterium]
MSKLRLFFLIILIFSSFLHCENDNPVPEVYVDYTIDLYNPLYQALQTVAVAVFIPNAGNKGIIVIKVDINKYSAFDATCTYDPKHEWGRVEIDANGIYATDNVCGSQFSLMMNGSVNKAPATYPLKEYAVDYNQNLGTLHIHN